MSGDYFVKRNATPFRDALLCEADGLRVLAAAITGSSLKVPDVVRVDEHFLEMTAIRAGRWDGDAWRSLAQGLARLHRQPCFCYGYGSDNYIGLNPQKNRIDRDWGEFFVDCRLASQIEMIKDSRVQGRFRRALASARQRLAGFLTEHCASPSLVHGDLWSGNAMCDVAGQVWLIDPAIYYGDREVDIAMTEMFGGFDRVFYDHYRHLLPLSPAYPAKKDIYNLYHYLNHYNLFGESYLTGCERGFAAIARL